VYENYKVEIVLEALNAVVDVVFLTGYQNAVPVAGWHV
jgi:hypothetical protein